jgi:hypothetical protein
MTECLSCQGGFSICQLCNPTNVIDPIDILRYSSSRDIPIIVLERIEIDEGDWDVPVLAF